MSAQRKKLIWLGTVGLGQRFGGVAGVARQSVRALSEPADSMQLARVVALLDDEDFHLSDRVPISQFSCRGSRKRFAVQIVKQVIQKPDLIIYDHLDLAQCQSIVPARFRRPYAVWVHGIEVWKTLPPRKQAALRDANLLIFNSEYTRTRFEKFHAFTYRGQVVPLTVDSPARTRNPTRPRRPWILTVGRLEPHRPKGHAEILRVLPKLVSRTPSVQWHVVGVGNHLDAFRNLVDRSGCSGNVMIHGYLQEDQLLQLYESARVFCMPSRGEGFGLVYLEAMSAGCVPIGSTLDAASEVIGDGGFCVSLESDQPLLDRLDSLLSMSNQDYSALSANATARAGQFSQSDFATRLKACIEPLVLGS